MNGNKTRAKALRATLKGQGGFTLVELIVVIAILGILAGVGGVAYAGYVERANKAVDQQLVADIAYAAQLAYVKDPSSFGAMESVVLSTDAEPEYSVTDGGMQTALKDAFGDPSTLRLKYGKWGGGSAMISTVANVFENMSGAVSELVKPDAEGNIAAPTFKDDVDDLFELIRDTAMMVGDGTDRSGAQLIADAAALTMNKGAGSADAADDFARLWAAKAWNSDYFMGDEEYDEDDIASADPESDFLRNAIANAGVLKARNISIATWLRDNGYPEFYDAVANYSLGSSSIVPGDILGDALSDPDFAASFAAKNPDVDMERFAEASTKIQEEYFPTASGDITQTQAYKDGLAYYAMMYTVNETAPADTSSLDDDTYWDDMSAAVSLYGSIARGETTLDDLKNMVTTVGTLADGQVMVMAMANGDSLNISVAPMSAKAS